VLALTAACVAAPASADLVRLKNGQTLEGDAVEVDGQVKIHSAVGTIGFPADLVLRIERGDSLERQAGKRLQALAPNDVEGRVQLALDLQKAGANTLAQRIFESVLARDPDHPTARRALGYVRCEEEWTTVEDCHRLHGNVLYQGRWVSAQERTALEELDHARRQSDLERLRADIQIESARLQAERDAASMSYGAGGYGNYDGYYDPYYFGGAPYYPYYPIYGFDPIRDRNRPVHHGDFGRGGQIDRPGGLHHQGGQPPRPLAPQVHTGTRTPAMQTSGRPR